jgi:hypothetical protein
LYRYATGTPVGGHPVRVMPSKTSVIPVNPQLLPQTEEEMERCARTVYVANVDHGGACHKLNSVRPIVTIEFS